jgi:hypothetical protein
MIIMDYLSTYRYVCLPNDEVLETDHYFDDVYEDIAFSSK